MAKPGTPRPDTAKDKGKPDDKDTSSSSGTPGLRKVDEKVQEDASRERAESGGYD